MLRSQGGRRLTTKNNLKNILAKVTLLELLKPSNYAAIARHFFSRSKKFSIVSAVYNAEEYIDDFLESIVNQTFDLSRVEVILVNDGSTDRTSEKIEEWVERHPALIQSIHQSNQGVSSARNAGLTAAKGNWITFTDPDDFVSQDYLSLVWKEISSRWGTHLALMCNVIFYMEQGDELRDTHPMRFRFSRKATMRVKNMGQKFHLQAATAFFDRHTIEKHKLQFDEKVVPVFEDAHFVNSLFLKETGRRITFLPQAKYYYRKREAQSSLMNTWRFKKSGFYDSLKYGNLDLVKNAQDSLGEVPIFLQNVNLYETLWKFGALRSNVLQKLDLKKDEIEQFWQLIDQIYKTISVKVIEKYGIMNGREHAKIGVLSLFKRVSRSKPRVYIVKSYANDGALKLRYYSGDDINCDFKAYRNNQEVPLQEFQRFDSYILDRLFFRTNFFKLSGQEDDRLSFSIDGTPAEITVNGSLKLGKQVLIKDAIKAFQQFEVEKNMDEDQKSLRRASLEGSRQPAYEGCWVFLDRKEKADDNAEHLYRHIKKTYPERNIFFVLARDSRDWNRLFEEGFALIEFGSQDHLSVFCAAEIVASSHCDVAILWPGGNEVFGDLFNFKFAFLQHGVTKDDLSTWLNPKHMDLVIAATEPEAEMFKSPSGPYIYTPNEVGLTGFPRHDRLQGLEETVDTLLIVPTWRKSIEDRHDVLSEAEMRGLKYCQAWSQLLRDDGLSKTCSYNGLKPLLLLHQNAKVLSSALSNIDIPKLRMDDVDDIQRLFKRSAALITDYSSIAFEFGYLKRPVMYYQFDKKEIFDANYHTYKKGYFDYELHGFGPIFQEPQPLLSSLEKCLENGLPSLYDQRATETFPFRDGQCSERVYQRIKSLSPIPNS